MPKETREQRPDIEVNEREDENRFSQEHDDQAGRIWHGLTSETERDKAGRFDEDKDAEEPTPPAGRTERV